MKIIAGLVLCVACLCSCLNAPGDSRQSPDGITIPFLHLGEENGWDIGHYAGDQFQRITEFVRPGQAVENWKELVTSHALNKTYLGSVEDHMAAYKKGLGVRCPGSTVEVIRQMPDGPLYEAHIVNCQQGADEYMLARILDGTSTRFIVQYGVRSEVMMTPERRAEWIEKLMAVEITYLQ